MNRNNLFEIEREALCTLMRLAEARVASETKCREKYEAAKLNANREVTRARKTIAADRERETQAISAAWEEARQAIRDKFTTEQSAADRLCDFSTREAQARAKTEEEKTHAAYSDAIWTADSVYEAAEKQANDQLDTIKQKAAAGLEAIESIWNRAAPAFERGGMSRADFAAVKPVAMEQEDLLERMEAAIGLAETTLEQLNDERSLRMAGGIAHLLVRSRARRRCKEIGDQLASQLAAAAQSHKELLQKAANDHKNQIQEGRRFRDGSKIKAQDKYPPLLAKISARCQAEMAAASDKNERDSERIGNWQHEASQRAEVHFSGSLSQCHERYDAALAEAEALFERRKAEARADRDEAWDRLAECWRIGQDRLIDLFNRLKAAEAEHFLPWYTPFWETFSPSEVVPAGMRFGNLSVDLNLLPGGVPEEEDLAPSIPIKMELPAFLPFPEKSALVIKAKDQGRALAVQELQTVMLRFLTAVPAGKVRFTIVDPVGLGDNFAAFMHLADYDENLIGSRIWTEPAQIEKRLADLTAHMENVIQKYLRNQYKTIEEYNDNAGEVAEPFRVLIVANFPVNFTLESARRLVSIVQSGSTCGVYSLITVDTKQPLPQGFNLADLELGSTNLVWKNDSFQWKDPDFTNFQLTLETPPPPNEVVRLVRIVGDRGKNANRIEVPFDYVAPKPDQIWKGDSRKSVAVPIGRSGATKQQMFQLGVGTAQHALIAGKTGSGKSTLLHALITNLALHYSPDEVELYLIDFKKGVEFKAYAEGQMPHARVVASESERECGLSVLQRLDGILRERGDRFRDASCNDLAGYRAFLEKSRASQAALPINGDANHRRGKQDLPASCPQILLVVDEFQEFFVEDDRVAQEAALLLDRLVRQGRAFGLHIVLGSQTLGGAYSLARSTIDQMAVRIALQCSDADAQLILNKDNTAARLLSRPGEAIYNDANGLLEGNDLFQIVWLSDARRDQALKLIRDLARDRDYPPPLVFEGNVAAEISGNQLLTRRLHESAWPKETRAASAWLGDAIAIKDPTAAVMRSNSGCQLLIIGQHEESALAILASALVGLAVQHDTTAKFLVIDGTPEDDPNWGYLGKVAAALPHQIDFVDRTNLAEHLGSLAALVSARQKNETPDRSARYVIVQGLHRYRDLRKAEDDFGFGRRGAERVVTPAENFASILKDGPTVGVHMLLWCDVLTNLNRSVDRPLMREFGLRVLFQMNPNDSSTLIDSPLASRLGRNRALFVTEEQANPEKFRPYGLPTAEWLKEVKARLEARTVAQVVQLPAC